MTIRIGGASLNNRFSARIVFDLIILFACILIFLRISAIFTTPSRLASDDFVEYWSAAKIILQHGNPYEPEQMSAVQASIGRPHDTPPLMMLNPPWALTVMIPFALLPYGISRAVWFLVQLGLVFLSASVIWRLVGGAMERVWLCWLIAFTLAPVCQALRVGQISLLLLLGITGFIYYHSKQNGFAAGLCTVFILIKPQIVYLFLPVYFLWTVINHRLNYLLGTLSSLIAASGLAMTANSLVFTDYLNLLHHYSLMDFASATWGSILRLLLGWRYFWLQYVPSIFGLCWLAVYFWRKRFRVLDWLEDLPLLTLISIVTTSYGWVFDQTVLLLPMLLAGFWLFSGTWSTSKNLIVCLYFALNACVVFIKLPQVYFAWVSSAYLGLYLACGYLHRRQHKNCAASLVQV